MPSLPIPLVAALVLGFMFLYFLLSDRRHLPLAMLLGLCAVQALIISLNQHYGLRTMATLQPVTATLIPPAAWIAFRMTGGRTPRWRDVSHLTATAAVPAAWILHPPAIDVIIPVEFAGYGISIFWISWRNGDGLVHSILEAGEWPRRIWQIVSLALIASAMIDVVIAVAMETGARHLTPWIVSVFSLANLLVVGVLCLSSARVTDSRRPNSSIEEVSDDDRLVMQRLETLMTTDRPYLDPDLTLARLARKLRLPAKQVSAAVNRSTGESISRFVNAARIEAAKSALTEGKTVTEAMFSSGFQTKSNFNREFLRIVGLSPTAWLQKGDSRMTGR